MKKDFKIRKFIRNPKKENLGNVLIKAPTETKIEIEKKKKKVGKEMIRIDNLLFASKNKY